MKKLTLLISTGLISFSAMAAPYNNNIPFFNSGNNNMGNSWNMPGMNWGNNRGFSNGSQWNMPNMNWGNNANRNGSNWNMPNFNWGNNNGYGNGSNWNMPSMNWGNRNGTGSNWNMPNMNWGNNNGYSTGYYPSYNSNNWRVPNFNAGTNNAPGNWMPNQNYKSYVQPTRPKMMPNRMPKAITSKPPVAMPKTNATSSKNATNASVSNQIQREMKIPMPTEVKGVILAPENKSKQTASDKTK